MTYKSAVSSGPELGQDLLALQRVAIRIVVQVLHHLGRDQGANPPAPRDAEHNAGCETRSATGRDEIRCRRSRPGHRPRNEHVLRRRNLERLPGGHSDSQNPLLAIMREEIRRRESRRFRRPRIAASCPSATGGLARSHIPGQRKGRQSWWLRSSARRVRRGSP